VKESVSCASCGGETAHVQLHSAASIELLDALIDGVCLSVVVPMTLAILEHDPMASAGHFEGDLLRGLMEVPGHFWTRHPCLYERYRAAVRRAAVVRRGQPAEESMRFWTAIEHIRPRVDTY